MRYTYLLIDLFTILVPLIFSFHPKLGFYRTLRSLLPAILITGIFFILWDSYFTSLGVWGFNTTYITSLRIGNLPIEEILFFLCIPYSCIFTFHCLSKTIGGNFSKRTTSLFNIALIMLFLIIAIFFHHKKYTAFSFITLPVLIAFAYYGLKANWLTKFYIVYGILLVPFLIVNGLLTGTGLKNPVVWYNNDELIGIRILTIPVEDIFYGMALMLLNMIIYSYLLSKQVYRERILS